MHFLLTCLWVWLIILHRPPTHYNDPSMTTTTGEAPDTIRFANQVLLDSYVDDASVYEAATKVIEVVRNASSTMRQVQTISKAFKLSPSET